MEHTPFHDYYISRMLEELSDKDRFVPVYASSNSKIYPFQIAAADFAIRSPYQKGAVLCDEAGLGKSHEAMLVITQKWLGGRRILLAVPNSDLLCQWTELMEKFYSVPYVILSTRAQWDALAIADEPNPFLQDAVVITTYDFAAGHEDEAGAVRRPTPSPPSTRRVINRQKPSSASPGVPSSCCSPGRPLKRISWISMG